MEELERIRTVFERNAKALEKRPSLGQGTATTTVRMIDGFTCEIEDGPWKLAVDMGAKSGGGDTGPNPGVYGRATLGSCLTLTYVMWAARLGVPISSLQVEVQADYDARGSHGVGDLVPGYEAIRYTVRVESPASEDEVQAMLDTADAHCDFLHVFRDPQPVERTVEISAVGGETHGA